MSELEQQTVQSVEPQASQQVAPVENAQETVQPETQAEGQNVTPQVENGQPEQPAQQEPTTEELKARLHEYEVREEEDRLLREKLGIQDIDSQTYNYMTIDQQIVNEGKQVYLRLCNEYGVDANPDKLDASVESLRATDPAKAYEFQRKFEALGNEVYGKRNLVKQQNAVYEVNKFANEYNQILNASPAINNIITQYVQTYGNGSENIYGQLQGVMDVIIPAYKEAFEAGKQYALADKAKRDTSAVNGGTITAGAQGYQPGAAFTRDQIAKMSMEEFTKYEKEIERQMLEGKIH